MNIPKAGSIMAGHVHPLIIPSVTETVLMVGDFTSSDASFGIILHSDPLGLPSALRFSNAEDDG